VSKRTRKTSPRTVCSMSQQNKPKREVWFEPRRNHSAEGLRCILPVLTAEREREGVCDVLNEPRRNHSAEGLRCILPVLTAEREREGVCDVLNEPRRNHSAEGLRCILPVLTAEREREGVRDVLNGLTQRPRARRWRRHIGRTNPGMVASHAHKTNPSTLRRVAAKRTEICIAHPHHLKVAIG
jgi:hypothetical protein